MKKFNLNTFHGLVLALQNYWEHQGCMVIQPLDIEIGAGTFHPITYFQAIDSDPIAATYIQPSRRPSDSRYGNNPNRLQHYYQLQVIIKPSPKNIQQLYLNSLIDIGLDLTIHDIRFIEDNWENPTLGAWGIGWEVWLNSMEITQFTYFQQVGGLECQPVMGEIAYGLERLAMCLQDVSSVYDIVWHDNMLGRSITYGDLFYQSESEQSTYNIEYANINFLFSCFEQYIKEAKNLLNLKISLPRPAYECIIKAIHIFNLLNARKAISVTERQYYILQIRNLTKNIAQTYLNIQKKLGYPKCQN